MTDLSVEDTIVETIARLRGAALEKTYALDEIPDPDTLYALVREEFPDIKDTTAESLVYILRELTMQYKLYWHVVELHQWIGAPYPNGEYAFRVAKQIVRRIREDTRTNYPPTNP